MQATVSRNARSCRLVSIARYRRRDRVRVGQRARFAGRLSSRSVQDSIVPSGAVPLKLRDRARARPDFVLAGRLNR